ncbi:GumC family protein [Altererythrobacter sp. MF3-039]|uniref:GumC family protein n=1 Tax=Altererythrobacter sp. MF3-039 TaxID=3252901 RepID=UPI00390C6A5A
MLTSGAGRSYEFPVGGDGGDPYAYPVKPWGDNPVSANLRYALAALRRNFWLAIAIVGAALALAVIATMLDAPRYSAATSVQINDQGDEVLGEELDGQRVDSSSWDIDRFLNTQLDILRSRALAVRVANANDLYDDPRFFAAMEMTSPEADLAPQRRRELVISLLRANLSIDLPRSTRIARVQFSSGDPEISARIVNSFADEFIQANLQRRFESSAYARKFVEEQLEEARSQLEETERDLNDYARSAGLIRTRDAFTVDASRPVAGSVTASSLLQLNEAANMARADRIAAQTRWRAESAIPLLSSRTVLANPTVQELMTRKARAQAELDAARERYLPDHPAVTNLANDLAAIDSQLTATASQVRNSVRAEYQAAQAAEVALQQQVDRLQGATLREQDRAVRYNTLAREADTARSIYDGLLQRYRELNASAGIAASNIAIIDRADPPLVPSSPSLPRNLALGLLAGLAAAVAAVYLRDRLDDAIHVPEDIEEKLGLALLGVVPEAEDEPFVDMANPKSPVAEAYNSLRGSLLYSTRHGLPKVLAVTSAQAGEGKTTSSHAIASGFGRMGMKALLIDADLRRPAAHIATGLANKRGLTDLLTSDDPLASAVQRNETGAFDLLPSGPPPPSPSELITSPRMAQLLEEASGHYDIVVLDSPPVLGLADAPMLAALADGTMFVVEAERGRSGQLRAALRRLRSVGPVLIGAVLVKFDPEKGGNRYSSYYGYEYYRYAKDEEGVPA